MPTKGKMIVDDKSREIVSINHRRDKVLELSNALLNEIAIRIGQGDRLAFIKPNDDGSLELTVIGINIPTRTEKSVKLEEEKKGILYEITKENEESVLALIDNVSLLTLSYKLQAHDQLLSELEEVTDAEIEKKIVRIEQDQIDLISNLTAVKIEALLNEITASRLVELQSEQSYAGKKYDAFLSYSTKDKDEARHISELLETEGIRVFLSEKNIKPSSKWEIEVREALKDSRYMCLLATPNSLNSEWVATEWGAAWALDTPIVPILFQCSIDDLSDRLRSYQAINFHETSKLVELLKGTKTDEAG